MTNLRYVISREYKEIYELWNMMIGAAFLGDVQRFGSSSLVADLLTSSLSKNNRVKMDSEYIVHNLGVSLQPGLSPKVRDRALREGHRVASRYHLIESPIHI